MIIGEDGVKIEPQSIVHPEVLRIIKSPQRSDCQVRADGFKLIHKLPGTHGGGLNKRMLNLRFTLLMHISSPNETFTISFDIRRFNLYVDQRNQSVSCAES